MRNTGWFSPNMAKAALSPEAQMLAEFMMDNAVGSTATVRRHIKVRTPMKLTRAQFNDFAADEMAQFKQSRIREIRQKNLRSR